MISTLAWVRRGVAQEQPERSQLTDAEFERIAQHLRIARSDLIDAEKKQDDDTAADAVDGDVTMHVESASPPAAASGDTAKDAAVDDELAIYNLDKYDEDDNDNDDDQENQIMDFVNTEDKQRVSLFSNIRGLAYHTTNKEDPYIEFADEEDEKEEEEEMRISVTDNLILAAKTEDDVSHLEVYVYEEEEDNLYVHHDVLLPSFPLCLEWLDFPVGRKLGREKPGNFVAVGTFEPHVEIWDLDRIDDTFPDCILGEIPQTNGADAAAGGKKHKKKGGPLRLAKQKNAERHVDAVMAISWNTVQRNLIATGSADTTVKLWDLNRPSTAIANYTHHRNKVQAVTWNRAEPAVLLTGGYDKKACAFDSRAPAAVATWSLSADVECIRWDPHHPERFFVSTEDGIVRAFDARVAGASTADRSPLFTLHAHDAAVSALDINPHMEGCIVTGSGDKTVKVWSLRDNTPSCIVSRDVGCGKVFSANFSCDSPYLVAIAGSRGNVVVWNLEHNAGMRRAFPVRQHREGFGSAAGTGDVATDKDAEPRPPRKELTAVESDGEQEDDDEGVDGDVVDGDMDDDESGEDV